MSLNALGANKLPAPAGASAAGAAAGAVYSWASGPYAGLNPSGYDVIVGRAGTLAAPFANGINTVSLSGLNIPSQAVADTCLVEAWNVQPALPAAAGTSSIGAKYTGFITFAAGPPATAVLTISAVDGTGALVPTFVGTCGFRVYIPRVTV
jgi:hypothetical protein